MIRNMGTADRMIRIVLAILFLITYLLGWATGTFAIILLVIAGVFFLTGIAGICPLYYLFRISSRTIT